MKPIKLTIQAFGPFAGKEEVNFAKLGSNPLFLINGPTGAGKSSVLDAICFALYGQTTGAEREASQMRCDHSDLSLLTEVSLEFKLGEKAYRIRRAPTQERSKSRGDGKTTQQAEAQLWELDGTEQGRLIVSKSVAEATAEIKSLIGLGVEQFRQVMVLPQGKFRELLMADSKERESIFSQLFETQIYKRIENKLKEKAAGIKQAVENHQSEVRGILQAAEVSSESELDQEVEELKPQLADAKLLKEKAEEQLKNAQRDSEQGIALNKRFDELNTKETELLAETEQESEVKTQQALLDHAMKVQEIYHLYLSQMSENKKLLMVRQQHDESKKTLESARDAQTKASEEWRRAEAAAKETDRLKTEKADLQRYEKQNIDLAGARTTLADKSNNATNSKNSLDDKNKEIELIGQELSEKEGLVDKYVKELEQLVPERQALDTLAEKLVERGELEKVRQNLQAATAKKNNIEDELKVDTAGYEKAKINATKVELAWHSGQAALLAGELTDDQPCPVCGSKNHPDPAMLGFERDLTTKQQVETARDLASKAEYKKQESKDALAKIANSLGVFVSQQKDSEKRLGSYANQTIEALKQEQLRAEIRVDGLLDIKLKKEAADLRISEIKKTLADSSQILASLETQAYADNNLVIQARTTVEQLEGQIPEEYRQPGILEKLVDELDLKIQGLTKHMSEADNSLKNKQTALDQAISTESTLLSQLDKQERLTTESSSAWLSALSESVFQDVEQFLSAQMETAKQAALKTDIENYRSSLDRLKGVVQALQLELEEKQRFNLDAMDQLLAEIECSFQEKDNAWRKYEARSMNLTGVKGKLKEAHLANEVLTKQYTVFGTLNDVANGATGNKISLQRFVLSVLLDDVLIQASHRLNIISKGRYQLVRKEDRAKGNKASGLELEVEDGDTGKPRSVATLSGGESFMAALSLALGLSDVVQSYAGGIKLDTLFIDEGFGSLDTESLDAVIRVLIDLQASGRMIGIISHVTELKEQMAMRLDVVGSPSGSIIKTIAA